MRIAIVTSCTATSTKSPAPLLQGRELPRDLTLQQAITEWKDRIERSKDLTEFAATPMELYRGEGYYAAMKMVDILSEDHDVELLTASIGFGLVQAEQQIVSYNINTWSKDEDSLDGIITKEPFRPYRWWSAINQSLSQIGNPITKLAESYDVIIVAMSTNFLGLIVEDLLNLVGNDKLYVVMAKSGKSFLPKALKTLQASKNCVFYDKRINDYSPGNRNDMAQRAALHFIEHIWTKSPRSPAEECNTVMEEMLDQKGQLEAKASKVVIDHVAARRWLEQYKVKKMGVAEAHTALQHQLGMAVPLAIVEMVYDSHQPKTAEVDSGIDILKGMIFEENTSLDNDAGAFLKVFVKSMASHSPGSVFTAKQVSVWAAHYATKSSQDLPGSFKSAKGTSKALKQLGPYLGINCLDKVGYGVAKYVIN